MAAAVDGRTMDDAKPRPKSAASIGRLRVRPPMTSLRSSLPSDAGAHAGAGPHGKLGTLTLAALGVVYGDIGTSPLYTIKECLTGAHGAKPTHENILGVLSLVVWSLTMVVAFKYLLFIVRAH